MTNKEVVLMAMQMQGKSAATDLRGRAADLDGTAIIAEEVKIPEFDAEKDYSAWAIGSPVRELVDGEYQVFKLLQPYNAANHPGTTPVTAPALWSICHTKDVEKAKPYMAPNGISGMYMQDEVCTKDGATWKSVNDNNAYPPNEVGTEAFWVKVM
jgi:hypothetical protein